MALREHASNLRPGETRVGFFNTRGQSEDKLVPINQMVVLILSHGDVRQYSFGRARSVQLSVLPMVHLNRRVIVGTKRLYSRIVGSKAGARVRFSTQDSKESKPVGLMRDLLEDDARRSFNYFMFQGKRKSIVNTGSRVSDEELVRWSIQMLDEEVEGEAIDPVVTMPRIYSVVENEDDFLTLRAVGARTSLNKRLMRCAQTGEWPIPGTGIMSPYAGVLSREGDKLTLEYKEGGEVYSETLSSAAEVASLISTRIRSVFGFPQLFPLEPVILDGERISVDELQTLYRPMPQAGYTFDEIKSDKWYEELCILAAMTSFKQRRGHPMLDMRFAHGEGVPMVDITTMLQIQRITATSGSLAYEDEACRADLFHFPLRYALKLGTRVRTGFDTGIEAALLKATKPAPPAAEEPPAEVEVEEEVLSTEVSAG